MVDSCSIYLSIISLPFIVLSRLVFLDVSRRMMTSVEEGNKQWGPLTIILFTNVSLFIYVDNTVMGTVLLWYTTLPYIP